MKKVKLGEIAKVVTKGTTPTSIGYNFENKGINFIKIESISETGEFLKDKFSYISKECNEKLNRSKLIENDILFSIAGAIGRVAIVNKEIIPANTNQALAIIRTDDSYDKLFLKYLLTSNYIKEQYNKKKQGVAQINLSLKDISELDIPVLGKEEQIEIANRLDKVQEIIDIRKNQIKQLNELIKSQFVEMFERGQYPKDEFINIAKEIYAGGDKPKDISKVQEGEYLYPVFANGYENEGLQGYSKDYRTGNSAVTISARGTIGYSFIRNEKFTPIVRLITIIPNEKVNVVYLKYAIDNMNIAGSGTSQAQLTVPDIKKKKITIPPLELQNKFAEFVKQIDKQKFELQKRLEELQKLQESLMNKYFGG